MERRGDEVIRIFCDWGTQVGVDVATDKTVMMLLKARLSHARHSSIRVGDNCIRYETEIRYLGIAMRERKHFHVHLDHIREKLVVVGKVRRILKND